MIKIAGVPLIWKKLFYMELDIRKTLGSNFVETFFLFVLQWCETEIFMGKYDIINIRYINNLIHIYIKYQYESFTL